MRCCRLWRRMALGSGPDCLARILGKFTYATSRLAALGSNAEWGLPAPARGEGGESHRSGPGAELPVQAGQ